MEGEAFKQFSSIYKDCLIFCSLVKQDVLNFTVYSSLKEDVMYYEEFRYEDLPENIQVNLQKINDLYQYLKFKHTDVLTFEVGSKTISIKDKVFGKERVYLLELRQKNTSKNEKNERKIKFLIAQNQQLKSQLIKKDDRIMKLQQKLKILEQQPQENPNIFQKKKSTPQLKEEKSQPKLLTNGMKMLIQFNYKYQAEELTEIIQKHAYQQIFNLSLQKCNLPMIPPLKSLINLKVLEIKNYQSANKIQSITNLNELTLLEELNLGCNKIKKIEGLNSLKKLRELYLYQNQIQVIQNLSDLISLEKLYLNKNKIENISKQLLSLKKLKEVRLYENEIDYEKPANKKILTQLVKAVKVMFSIGQWYKSES